MLGRVLRVKEFQHTHQQSMRVAPGVYTGERMADTPKHAGYKNPTLSTDERGRDLLSRMTV